jgi:hypothetical protein
MTPWDGELAGPPSAAECAVEDTPPTTPVAVLDPPEPIATRALSVAIRAPSADRDGDPVVYRYAWTRDGIATPHREAAVPAGDLRHGETWRVEVTPSDGEREGAPLVLSASVGNTLPPAPAVSLVPAAPAGGEAVTCVARAPERDADLEPVTVRYRWYREGRATATGDSSATLPAGVVRRGERWRCEAWTSDGTGESARVLAEATVRNSPPAAPAVEIEPEVPRRGDDLVCRIAAPSADPDGDPVSYSYAWTRNGKAAPPGSDPARVPGARVSRGERWRCAVTPSDGAAGGPAGAAERTVANTAPGPAMVRIEPRAPRAGERMRCDVVARSEDADGDAVRYRFSWQRDGALQPFAGTSQEVPARLVKPGDRWRCVATPTDGAEDGPPAGTEEVLVAPAEGVEEGGAQAPSERSTARSPR